MEWMRESGLILSDWLWPAIWMLPTDDQYGSWPKSGEIDVSGPHPTPFPLAGVRDELTNR
jgi:beta-glucanase (GH16 family)